MEAAGFIWRRVKVARATGGKSFLQASTCPLHSSGCYNGSIGRIGSGESSFPLSCLSRKADSLKEQSRQSYISRQIESRNPSSVEVEFCHFWPAKEKS